MQLTIARVAVGVVLCVMMVSFGLHVLSVRAIATNPSPFGGHVEEGIKWQNVFLVEKKQTLKKICVMVVGKLSVLNV